VISASDSSLDLPLSLSVLSLSLSPYRYAHLLRCPLQIAEKLAYARLLKKVQL